MKIYQKLSVIRRSVPKVNYGGCGWMALYLYEYFKRKEIDCKIVQFKVKWLFGLTHFMVKAKGYYFIDVNGRWSWIYAFLLNLPCCKKYTYSKHDLEVRLSNQKLWNKKFNPNYANVIKIIMEK